VTLISGQLLLIYTGVNEWNGIKLLTGESACRQGSSESWVPVLWKIEISFPIQIRTKMVYFS